MSEHTPGPWIAWPNPGNPAIYEGGDAPATIRADGRYIAAVRGQAGETMSNARLIAAAPELLAACEELVAEFDTDGEKTPFGLNETLGIEWARAAINKARGEA